MLLIIFVKPPPRIAAFFQVAIPHRPPSLSVALAKEKRRRTISIKSDGTRYNRAPAGKNDDDNMILMGKCRYNS